MFHDAGHDVIGADFESHGVPVSGRFSRALRRFYALPKPTEKDGSAYYIHDLLQIVRRERVQIWVSCSGVASAVEDGQAKENLERRTDCIAIQFDVASTTTLHEKHTFIQHTRSLGLPAPETHNVTSRAAVHKVLNATPSGGTRARKQYIMKSVGVDDALRGNMTLLPRRTTSKTYQHVSNIPISCSKPWVLQQYIHGKEYCTHALVVNGHVKAFVACPSAELLMHYEALPPTSALSRSMLRFTQEFAARSPGQMTGHLSFDFLVDESATEKGLEMVLQPIECNPRAHTAVVLFNDLGPEMAAAYLSALDPMAHTNDSSEPQSSDAEAEHDSILAPTCPAKYYWLGHDIVTLLFLPLLSILQGKMGIGTYMYGLQQLATHVLFWKDGTFEAWDPLPWWWLNHIYWPGVFLASVLGDEKWSRVNVSTGKVFGC
ncbi:hypothetical protein MMC07_006313 [Pseudocyphellaria aurata]|nr:hypothetical protein [Pseudocyphellaria aurata]